MAVIRCDVLSALTFSSHMKNIISVGTSFIRIRWIRFFFSLFIASYHNLSERIISNMNGFVHRSKSQCLLSPLQKTKAIGKEICSSHKQSAEHYRSVGNKLDFSPLLHAIFFAVNNNNFVIIVTWLFSHGLSFMLISFCEGKREFWKILFINSSGIEFALNRILTFSRSRPLPHRRESASHKNMVEEMDNLLIFFPLKWFTSGQSLQTISKPFFVVVPEWTCRAHSIVATTQITISQHKTKSLWTVKKKQKNYRQKWYMEYK